MCIVTCYLLVLIRAAESGELARQRVPEAPNSGSLGCARAGQSGGRLGVRSVLLQQPGPLEIAVLNIGPTLRTSSVYSLHLVGSHAVVSPLHDIRANEQTMPSYAVLGATGNTGSSLIRVLMQSPEKQINAYCRSRTKLLRLCPEAGAYDNIHIWEGPLAEPRDLVDCLRGTQAAFLAVAQSDNVPGCTIAYDTARIVVAALRILQKEKVALPKLIVLSSASLEPKFTDDVPQWVHTMLYYAASHVYKDLEKAEALLRDEQSWIPNTTWIKPGGLSHDKQQGHVLSKNTAKTPLSFLDLAAGMIEVADDMSGDYAMRNVAVNPTAKHVAFPWDAPVALFRGLLFHFLPWTYRFLAR